MAIASYLKRTSDRGIYSYRRIVPADCRASWGAREHKISLKTKSHPEALRRAAMVNTEFDKRVALIRQVQSGEAVPTSKLLEEGKDILKREGLHPQQVPATQEEAMKFFARQREWSDLYLDSVPETNSYDYDGSISTEYPENTKNPHHIAYEILKGRQTASIVPTLGEATDSYLKANAEKVYRTPHNQKKHEQRVRRAIDHLDKLDVPITEFNRIKARQHKEALRKQNATWAENTLDRAILILSAVFASAIKEYELTMTNPWLGLAASRGGNDASTSEVRENKRRSFTPEELDNYKHALLKLNREAALIDLLMVQTGSRTMEVGGLLFKDVKLDGNIPHVQIRYNRIRGLKTKNSVRDVPLVGAALDELRDYLSKLESPSPEGPLFPKYGRDGGMDAVSQLLNGVIRKRLKIRDKSLVAYSAQGRERCRAGIGSVAFRWRRGSV
jgi:integrase